MFKVADKLSPPGELDYRSINSYRWGYLIVVLIAAIPLFGHLGELPIVFFDEQRLATNALEMNNSGNILLTTYDGRPEHDNTKPPLMIWLQAISMQMLGSNEVAIRLPSALAALATCLLIYGFCARRFRSPLTGICSVLILCTAKGYIDIHGTRTGDYDSLLTLFTTLYCTFWFAYLEDKQTRQLYLFFITAMLAVMTKCTAACIMFPFLGLYTLLRGQVRAVLGNIHFWIGAVILIVPVAAWYICRSRVDPGYMDAAWLIDLGGRYSLLSGVVAGPDYYLSLLAHDNFVPWLTVSVAGIVVAFKSTEAVLRRLCLFLCLISCGLLLVLSFSETKWWWYILPIYPLLSILGGICIRFIVEAATNLIGPKKTVANIAIQAFAIGTLFVIPYMLSLDRAINHGTIGTDESTEMGFFMRDVVNGKRSLKDAVVAIETYQGNIRWYFKVLAQKGRPVTTIENRQFRLGQTVVAYQPEIISFIDEHFQTLLVEDFHGVKTYRIIQAK